VLFRVLGPVEIWSVDGEPVEVVTEGQRRLVALLLIRANAWVDAAEVSDKLDGGNAKTGVHHLRQLLPRTADGSARINGRSGRYRLNVAPGELDAAAFEGQIRRAQAAGDPAVAAAAYREALSLWRGRPYTGFDRDTAVEAEAQRLTGLLWTARDGLADALGGLGRHSDAVALLRPFAAQDPGRRATWERLAAALYADGRRDEAATTFHQARRALGGDPGDTLRELHERLLSENDPAAERTQRIAIPRSGAGQPWPGAGQPQHDAGQPWPGPATAPDPSEPDLPADVRRLTEEDRPWTDWRVERVHKPRRRAAALLGALAVLAALTLLGVAALASRDGRLLGSSEPVAQPSTGSAAPGGSTSTAQSRAPSTTPLPPGISLRRPVPGQPAAGGTPSVLFGASAESPLVRNGRTRLLSTRYRGHGDLATVAGLHDSIVADAYRNGFALHLVLDDDSAPGAVTGEFGPGCGRPYPLTDGFIADVTQLAITFGGAADGPPLFVTMFDGVETYACRPGAALADPATTAYYRALLGRYVQAREVFHKLAPNALVGLGWHSALTNHSDPTTGAGASMFEHFGDALRLSDFTSVSAVSDRGNVDDVRAAVLALGAYAPVLVSYDAPAAVADQDLRGMLTEDYLREATSHGLFAWTFGIKLPPRTLDFATDAATRFGREPR
jgi:DNA-binding SARP family transcriptional activator